MKVVVLYRPRSEHSAEVEAFFKSFKRDHGNLEVELMDVDSPAGVALASLYDIWQYPAILAVENDGRLANMWVGNMLPRQNDILGYLI